MVRVFYVCFFKFISFVEVTEFLHVNDGPSRELDVQLPDLPLGGAVFPLQFNLLFSVSGNKYLVASSS